MEITPLRKDGAYVSIISHDDPYGSTVKLSIDALEDLIGELKQVRDE